MPDPVLTPDVMLQAYAMGIFPMADTADSEDLFWVDPKWRGIIPIDGFHMSRSLTRRLRKGDVHARLNHDFAATVSACADRDETWINPQLHQLYQQLNQSGYAIALDVWDGDALLGGVFGLALGTAFFGESMYSAQRDGSKLALAFLIEHLRCCGFTLFDTQFITDHLATLGAIEIPRDTYHSHLETALSQQPRFTYDLPTAQGLLQRRTQTS